jgi:hopanoid biosynthesis associated glycosyl transferase protein HpnI
MPPIPPSTVDSGLLLAALALVYPLLTLLATLRPRREIWRRGPARAVTVLKPLHGTEPHLRENLRSHFTQAATTPMQLLFGLRSADDPAADIVRRLQAEFPQVDAQLLVDSTTHGINGKVGNLINLLPHARHDWLLVTDADVSLTADDLRRICAPLADPGVGVVTCLYHGRPLGGLWTRLGALFIDDWFVPAARLAHRLGRNDFGFGAAMALRRDALDKIGGFRALADCLADDYWLAALIRRHGLRTVLSEVVVTTDVSETRGLDVWRRELRGCAPSVRSAPGATRRCWSRSRCRSPCSGWRWPRMRPLPCSAAAPS